MNPIKKMLMLITALSSLFIISGCSSLDIEPWVKPYERQNLADPIMRFGRHPIANMHVAHVLEARESARGAEGTGGGGCGCN
ncbi:MULTISPECIES: DUF4266 domain-containing protein [unclassified Shewanella]|nr:MULTISPECIES: DUF4266 domain-containing protein [unclassified Shewanella]MDO6619133.1 DUF4266 domain-containing protein [Shewanella sp. 6_MG-2023]MDO6641363.1 DUF4266 domain-containing protein [Shewanella sp. 5_MG-2023]MDO6677300.1 DUF4266 domain-containing protein [Shewanella sp. 4_MG-2023]MDO6773960.1 DUF4266 domain-containing protein [Shewanella sp. 3_MG-2023]PMG27689.1 hypothetical protein BCU94_04795 [Shewanella sp. 10N.286.52.C2]